MKELIRKNYLFDLYPEYHKDFYLQSRKDPDKSSKQLYDDLKEIFFSDEQLKKLKCESIQNRCQNFGDGDFYTLFIDDGKGGDKSDKKAEKVSRKRVYPSI